MDKDINQSTTVKDYLAPMTMLALSVYDVQRHLKCPIKFKTYTLYTEVTIITDINM